MQREKLENKPFLCHRSAAQSGYKRSEERMARWHRDTEEKEAETKGAQCEGELLRSSIGPTLSSSVKLRLLIFTHKISLTQLLSAF